MTRDDSCDFGRGVDERFEGHQLTLQIKPLPNELHDQKTANEKLIPPNRTQLWLRGPENKD